MPRSAARLSAMARVPVAATPERRAETAAMLRFAGGLHLVAGRVVVEAELDHGASVRRLRAAITDLYGLAPEIVVVSGGNLRRGTLDFCLIGLRVDCQQLVALFDQ